ncbi:LPS assembly protein LptD [Sulfurimonas sp. NW15]|uniref:LPS-assembly protein LptD n=1 Tax=Sulfurimonas sp. NW15 TaxID=2922729 RepID=UPI003DAA3E77
MLKYFLFFLLACMGILIADDKIEIYASSVKSKNNIVYADGGVSVVYKDYFLTAQRAVYNQKTQDLELFGKVRLNHNKKYKILGKYAKLNLAKKERYFKPLYLLENKSDVWISANEGESKGVLLDITSGSVSGCDPVDPLWTMEFSSSEYNTDSKWINLYNARLYIYDIPVFYTPYFGYSLDTTRRTGLLKPSFGVSSTEGFYYEQPIYIAEQNWWDLEINPQIRTTRGKGLYTTFRFVDSAVSHGEFKAGYFKENEEYYLKYNLQNQSHYGFNFKYDNTNPLNQWLGLDLPGQSGIYADINHMNDVDYINLAQNNNALQQATATQVLSRVNLFYNTNDNYTGAYFKYYEDLTLQTNDNTLQKLPTVQYHHYVDTFLKDHLLYSFDVQSNNIQRIINKKVIQTDVNLPVTLQTPLFGEYVNLSYKANLYLQHSQFSGHEQNPIPGFEYHDGFYASNYNTVTVSTQLTKAYANFSHVVGFEVSYNAKGWSKKDGFYQDNMDYCSDFTNKADPNFAQRCEFYNIATIQNDTQLNFQQYFYDSTAQEIIYHRLSQNISYENTKERYGDLENELDYKITSFLSYYNNMFYNYKEKKFSKILNQVSFNRNGVKIALSHLYKNTFLPKTATYTPYTSYLTSNVKYTYNKHYSYNTSYNYDLESKERKSFSFGFLYTKRCWDFGVQYTENNRPVLTTVGSTSSSVYDRFIYLTIVLKPLMKANAGSSFLSYKLPDDTR